ncbi:GM11374 [Drosophila sechellia]|uniref:GM11374 n=1 Tax=Drosophila sechellia TaxID=7238 RepID=B4IDG9_DROSE|nr:GM11374 [Drosophila sechellia]
MRCTLMAFCATMSLVRRMNTMIKQGAALPFNTSSCYVNATKRRAMNAIGVVEMLIRKPGKTDNGSDANDAVLYATVGPKRVEI